MELETATESTYRKSNWVQGETDMIQITLEPYRYSQPPHAMAETCHHFNATDIR